MQRRRNSTGARGFVGAQGWGWRWPDPKTDATEVRLSNLSDEAPLC